MSTVTPSGRRSRRRPGRPPGPSQAPEQRERLVAAARRLYAAGGYDGLSFAAIAHEAGITKPTVFHYFPNKESVVLAVFESFGRRLGAAAEGWFDPPPESYAARLERLVAALVDFYGADPLNARILCHGILESDRIVPADATGAISPPVLDRFVRRFVAFLRAGMETGELWPGDAVRTMLSIGGVVLVELMLPGAWDRRVAGDGPGESLEVRGRRIAEFVRRAVVRPANQRASVARRKQL